jgi:hypothetical protein
VVYSSDFFLEVVWWIDFFFEELVIDFSLEEKESDYDVQYFYFLVMLSDVSIADRFFALKHLLQVVHLVFYAQVSSILYG